MKARLQTSLAQQLVMTPQLRQAIKLLQMSTTELEVEIAEAVETNPLLEWADEAAHAASDTAVESSPSASTEESQREEAAPAERDDDWSQDELQWTGSGSGGSFDDDESGGAAERVAESETLADHLLWQLHLSPLSPRDRQIGAILIDALDEDGYLREPLSAILETLALGAVVDEADVLTVLHQIQRFDPVGVGARTLGECLALQLAVLDP
ncbi:RNA polymerase factor sigma-54, partial [Xanthomonas oryzae pv. oryzae]